MLDTISVILVFVVVSPVITGRVLSEEEAQMVVGLIPSFIAILSMYVGSKLRK